MNGVARISFGDGALVMPARNRYDRELVFEQAEFYARRHGKATLELDRREMLVTVLKERNGQSCSKCGQGDGILNFVVGTDSLCRHCARRFHR